MSKTLLWVNQFASAPDNAGGTRHYEIGKELTKRGWQVTIAASDFLLHSRVYSRRQEHDRLLHLEDIDGVRFMWAWAAAYTRNDWRRAWNWLSFYRSLMRTRQGKTDVVIGSSPQPLAAFAALRLAKRWEVPFVLEVRDLWPESLVAAGGRKGLAYAGIAALVRYLYREAEQIVVLAHGTMQHLVRLGISADKIVYVPNGVDPQAFQRIANRANGQVRLVYAGAHGPANGLDVILAAAELLRGIPAIRFTLVGDGPAKALLVERAQSRGLTNVEFLDPIAKQDIPSLLAACDAGLMILRDSPLFSFGVSPNKLFDYLAAGLPVICNVPGGVSDMLLEAKAGIQCRDSSGAALAEAVKTFLGVSDADKKEMSQAGSSWVAQNHSRAILAERLDNLLTDLVQQ